MDKSYFRSSGYTTDSLIDSESGDSLDIGSLSPFLRTLMVMDGTVTKALSAWFWEPITVISIKNQQTSDLTKLSIQNLDIKINDSVLLREVALQGSINKKNFAYARSIISLQYLPSDIAQSLKKGEIGIGELLREKGVETYRDIFDISYLPTSDDDLLKNIEGATVSRSYKILVNGISAIIVTEFFPINIFSD